MGKALLVILLVIVVVLVAWVVYRLVTEEPPVTPTPTRVPTPAAVSLERETAQVWHEPSGQNQVEVESTASAYQNDRIWTENIGQALLKWPDLHVRLYRDGGMQVNDVTPLWIVIGLDAGTALSAGKRDPGQRLTWNTDYAEITLEGTTFQVTYDPGSELTLVRVFDGELEVKNLNGATAPESVGVREWAVIEPDERPLVSNNVEQFRTIVRDLGLWALFRDVEEDVREGFGPRAAQLPPGAVDFWFETPTSTPIPTPTYTPTPTPDVSGPPAPALREPDDRAEISCTTGDEVNVTLRWSSTADVSGIGWYDVEVEWYDTEASRLQQDTIRVEGDQYQTLFSARCDTDHEWRVRAADGLGNEGAWSHTRGFRVMSLIESDIYPPQVPSNLQPGSTQVTYPEELESCEYLVLGWNAASDGPYGSGIAYYELNLQERSQERVGDSWEPISAYSDRVVYGTQVNVSTAVTDGYFRWQVRARDEAGNWSSSSEWRYFQCPDITPPPAPVALSPGRTDPNDPEYDNCPWLLDWTSVYDPSGVSYHVVLDRKPWNGTWQQIDFWYPVYPTQLTVSGCSEATDYRWRVRAQDGAGNWSYWSQYLYYSTTIW